MGIGGRRKNKTQQLLVISSGVKPRDQYEIPVLTISAGYFKEFFSCLCLLSIKRSQTYSNSWYFKGGLYFGGCGTKQLQIVPENFTPESSEVKSNLHVGFTEFGYSDLKPQRLYLDSSLPYNREEPGQRVTMALLFHTSVTYYNLISKHSSRKSSLLCCRAKGNEKTFAPSRIGPYQCVQRPSRESRRGRTALQPAQQPPSLQEHFAPRRPQ